MIALLVFALVFGVLGANWWFRVHQINSLANTVGGRRLLGRGTMSIETDDCVVDVVEVGWRVEVPRVRLGRRMVLTLDPGISPQGVRTGFVEVDRAYRISSDDADLTATIFADPKVRETLLTLQAAFRLRRVDLLAGEKLVVLGRRRRKVGEKAALDAVVAFARALDDLHDVKATVSAGSDLSGGVGGSSGSPFAMPIGR